MRGARLVSTFAATTAMAAWAVIALADAPAAPRQRELLNMLRQDCGACHGLTLQGGLGPALTAPALAGKPPEMLRDVIVNGRPNTPMPPWRPFLTDSETAWLVEQLQNGVSDAR